MSDPTSNVFAQQEQAPQEQQQAPLAQEQQPQSGDIYSDQLKNILAEDGRQKYDSVDKALEALAHSQSFIPTLQAKTQAQEEELTQLREALAKSKGVQEVVDSLSQHQQQGQEGNPSETRFGEEEVARLLEETLEKRSKEQQRVANSNKVNDTLTATYGDKAIEVVQAKAKELNTTPSELGKLAEQNPDLVLSLFGSKAKSPSAMTSSFQSSLTPKPAEPLGRPEKSLLSGATSKEQAEYMRKVKADIYAKYQITEN